MPPPGKLPPANPNLNPNAHLNPARPNLDPVRFPDEPSPNNPVKPANPVNNPVNAANNPVEAGQPVGVEPSRGETALAVRGAEVGAVPPVLLGAVLAALLYASRSYWRASRLCLYLHSRRRVSLDKDV